ncbi:hypothetical protein LCGC14_0997230 [marine sediment metagenome]|uniref:DNA 5'-3' helicase DnaB n=1 Tax=marine sediment metagenome TaxID=412755 RepID=A0A0F9QMK9_9ZZZZ
MDKITQQKNKLEQHHIKAERQIIHLMLKDLDAVYQIVELFNVKIFSPMHRLLVSSIFREFADSGQKRLLTEDNYRQMAKNQISHKGDLPNEMKVFSQCQYQEYADMNNFGMLKNQLTENYMARIASEGIHRLTEWGQKDGYEQAIENLIEYLRDAQGMIESRDEVYDSVTNLHDRFMARLEEERTDTSVIVRSGLPELDDVVKGFRPRGFTTFLAVTGGHKCVPGHAICYSSEGYKISVQDLESRYREGRATFILSLNEQTMKTYAQEIQGVFYNGVKDCYRIITQMGFRSEATENHPYLTKTGYKRLDQLETGEDYIAVSRDANLLKTAESNMMWDKVISKQHTGVFQTYDISMNKHHNFVVDNCITHNTNMMLNLSLCFVERGHKVLFIPLEMSYYEMLKRMIANRVGISGNVLNEAPQLSDDDFQKIDKHEFWQNYTNFHMLDPIGHLSVDQLERCIEKRFAKFQPNVIIVDYLDNIYSEGKSQPRHLEIGSIIRSLRNLGRSYDFHTITAAQLNRAAIKAIREGHEDAVDSTAAHGSHNYASDSDNLFAILPMLNEPNRLKLLTIKARQGPSGQTQELNVIPDRYAISSTKDYLQTVNATALDMDDVLNEPTEQIEQQLVQFSNVLELPDDDLLDL